MATPIGNMGDLSPRAAEVLAGVDLVACEDTRVTGRLLAARGIAGTLRPYHDHNASRMRPGLLKRLRGGARIALVSDAGTPLISDPGWRLVAACHEAGIPVRTVPGPSAAIAALTVAGLPTDRFLFAGFLPPRTTARRKALVELAEVPATLVLYESPRRIAPALADMAEILGPRPAAVCRELTKLHEEVRRGSLEALAGHFRQARPPKGEIVVVVAPPGPPAAPSDADLDARLGAALAGGASLRDAAAEVAAELGLPRRRVYARALELARARRAGENS